AQVLGDLEVAAVAGELIAPAAGAHVVGAELAVRARELAAARRAALEQLDRELAVGQPALDVAEIVAEGPAELAVQHRRDRDVAVGRERAAGRDLGEPALVPRDRGAVVEPPDLAGPEPRAQPRAGVGV